MYEGLSTKISMEEIYGIDYKSAIYKLTTNWSDDVTIIHSNLWQPQQQLTSSREICGTFPLLWESSEEKQYFEVALYAETFRYVYMNAFISLPNQARSFDQFQLFNEVLLLDDKQTFMEFLIYSLKFLQKRSTEKEPCIDVDNYNKVYFRF
jgi:hypothetical protein